MIVAAIKLVGYVLYPKFNSNVFSHCYNKENRKTQIINKRKEDNLQLSAILDHDRLNWLIHWASRVALHLHQHISAISHFSKHLHIEK